MCPQKHVQLKWIQHWHNSIPVVRITNQYCNAHISLRTAESGSKIQQWVAGASCSLKPVKASHTVWQVFTVVRPGVTYQTCFSLLRENIWGSGGCIHYLKGPDDRMMKGFILCVFGLHQPRSQETLWKSCVTENKSSAKASAQVF